MHFGRALIERCHYHIILKGCEVTSGGNVKILTSRMKATTHDHRPQIGFQKHGEIHHCIASLLLWASVEHWKSNDITTKGSTKKWFSKWKTHVQHFTSVLGQLSHYYLGIDETDGLISEHIDRGIDGQLNNKKPIDTHYLHLLQTIPVIPSSMHNRGIHGNCPLPFSHTHTRAKKTHCKSL